MREGDQYGLISMTNSCEDMPDVLDFDDLRALSGTLIAQPQWDEIRPNICFHPEDDPSEGFAHPQKVTCNYYVRKNGLWGILDESGLMLQEPTYEEINIVNRPKALTPFLDADEHIFLSMFVGYVSGRVLVRQGAKWGMLRGHADVVLPVVYDSIDIVIYYMASANAYIVSRDERYGVVNSHGKFYIPLEYPPLHLDYLDYMWNSSVFRIDGKNGMGYVRLGDGKCMVEPEWDDIDIERLYLSPDDEPYGYIFIVWENGHCGLIYDYDGMIIPPIWDEIVPCRIQCSDPLSYSVRRGDLWGCCDEKGHLICDAMWDKVNIFLNGAACVEKDGQWGAIGADGQLRVAVEWDEIEGFGITGAKNDALAHTNAGVLLGLGQDTDTSQTCHLSLARRNGLWGVIDVDGHIVVKPTYKRRNNAVKAMNNLRTNRKGKLQ